MKLVPSVHTFYKACCNIDVSFSLIKELLEGEDLNLTDYLDYINRDIQACKAERVPLSKPDYARFIKQLDLLNTLSSNSTEWNSVRLELALILLARPDIVRLRYGESFYLAGNMFSSVFSLLVNANSWKDNRTTIVTTEHDSKLVLKTIHTITGIVPVVVDGCYVYSERRNIRIKFIDADTRKPLLLESVKPLVWEEKENKLFQAESPFGPITYRNVGAEQWEIKIAGNDEEYPLIFDESVKDYVERRYHRHILETINDCTDIPHNRNDSDVVVLE